MKQAKPNQIFTPAKISFLGIAGHEVKEPMIVILLVVGFFYSLWGKLEDTATIFAVIFFLILAEVYNEFRAKKAIASLEKIAAPKTRILRESQITEINSEDIAIGDILILTPGTRVAADARVRQGVGLQIDESPLTGESFSQEKNNGDEVFAGTAVVSGESQALVFAVGKNTKIGQTAAMLKEIKPPKTALQLAMKALAGKLVYLSLSFSALIPILGILQGRDLKAMVLIGLSLSFAVIPEELPIIITMVLGLGAYTLSKSNFLVKKIKAAETLGNATVIVTDKTGTITESRMKIVSLYPANQKEIIEKALSSLSRYSLSPMEREIKIKAAELGIAEPQEIVREMIFDNNRKSKSIVRVRGDAYELFSSGAPEEIFTICRDIGSGIRDELAKQTSIGRRVIAIAHKEISPGEEKSDFARLEKGLIFVGLISFEDPPREGVRETVDRAAKAGIRTVMVTGDHLLTARFIAEKVGILERGGETLTGQDLDDLNDQDLQSAVKTVSVFARTTPQHKHRIVQALQKNGEVVAVTGDGINDALALKAADIGIAMGIKGTDVAKEASEVVLADDNYNTIAQGIFEGRKFFDNLQKGIKYYLSVKTALISIFLLPVLLGIPLPFAPIQIIILELFMDLAASASFVTEPREKNIYSRPPRNPKESLVSGCFIKDVLIKGAVLSGTVSLVYLYAIRQNFSLAESQTFAFTAWLFGHIVLAFISRSDKESIFSLGISSNKIINLWAMAAVAFLVSSVYLPFLRDRLNLFPISLGQLLMVALIASSLVGLLEIKKLRPH